jgi:FkbM family methyltransferase
MEIVEKLSSMFINALPEGIKYRIRKDLLYQNKLLTRANESRSNSYSQEGEDLVLARLFDKKTEGFYVDVGAYDPVKYSNTLKFYELGWRGINIDARPNSMLAFEEKRPRDINIETAVGTKAGTQVSYYAFEEGAYNTTEDELAEEIIKNRKSSLLSKLTLNIDSLENILDKHLPSNTAIDFMSVDVEGADLDVLKSNNWAKYTPKVLVVESYGSSVIEDMDSDISKYLGTLGYKLVAKTINTMFFKSAT